MKKLFGAFIALFSSVALAATTVPVQLLSPTGSSSGQAIVSTGSSSAPAWGGIGVNGIAAIAANTVLANATGSSASPTAFAMPSCSASGSALNWTTSTGFTCRSTYAMTTGATFTGAITPSTTAGIVGTTLGDNVNAGSIGEYVTATSGSVSLTTVTNANISFITLTAGDWDVWGAFNYSAAATTTTSSIQAGISSVSAGLPANPLSFFSNGTFPTNTTQQHAVPQQRFSLSTTTTIYLVATATFATSTATAQGFIAARRVR